ncbi:ABC transporter ATP-binding protein [Ureaplasma ceti]|uniref:ABC transporter domain-containing protein n=1 Tax=Ureaplasma ceti TaxID=3119530 RepID=A0ABP9U692_9BACT
MEDKKIQTQATETQKFKSEYAVEMIDITKTFLNGKVVANDKVQLKVKTNEVHAIIGENGAGKSTLMSMLFGIYTPDSGIIRINGQEVNFTSAKDADKVGLGMVHQHFKLVDEFSIWENVILGSEGAKTLGIINAVKIKKVLKDLVQEYDFKLNLDKKVKEISVGQQQKTEILKLLYRNANILIFDEPTAVLSQDEIASFLKMILHFKEVGKTVIIITHKLAEIKAVADSATVIRRGKYIGDFKVKDKSIPEIAEMMVGKKIAEVKNAGGSLANNPVKFEVNNLDIYKLWKSSRTKTKFLDRFKKAVVQQPKKEVQPNTETSELNNQSIKELWQALQTKSKTRQRKGLFYSPIDERDEIYDNDFKRSTANNPLIKDELDDTQGIHHFQDVWHGSNTTTPSQTQAQDEPLSNSATSTVEKASVQQEQTVTTNTTYADPNKVNFKIRAGEIYAIAGVEGNGQSELALALAGLLPNGHSKIILNGHELNGKSVKKRYDLGLSNVPEDRHKHGLVLDLPIDKNSVLQEIVKRPYSVAGFMNSHEITKHAIEIINKYDVRGTSRGTTAARLLSGGNQQKLIIGREMEREHELLILVQPTRGMDLGAIAFIHEQILKEKEAGKAILLISYELDEILGLADTIAVMQNGVFLEEGPASVMTKQHIGELMAGRR